MQNAALDQILAAQRGWDSTPFKDGGLGNANGVAEFLMNFRFGTLRARRDLGSNDTRTPLVGGYQNRPKGC
jgi:hypothetical protein